jgi:hypothetical protein
MVIRSLFLGTTPPPDHVLDLACSLQQATRILWAFAPLIILEPYVYLGGANNCTSPTESILNVHDIMTYKMVAASSQSSGSSNPSCIPSSAKLNPGFSTTKNQPLWRLGISPSSFSMNGTIATTDLIACAPTIIRESSPRYRHTSNMPSEISCSSWSRVE